MKTLEIKDLLKKDLLIIETSEQIILTTTATGYMLRDNSTNEEIFIEGHTLLGKPDEISEEEASELAHFTEANGIYFWKSHDKGRDICLTAKDALLSAIETVIYWDVNPEGEFPRYNFDEDINPKDIKAKFYYLKWHEAQSRTFDRNRSIILVKN